MRTKFVAASLYNVTLGTVFALNEHPDNGFYMPIGESHNGWRKAINLCDGTIEDISATAEVTAYPDAELIIKAKA